MLCRVAYSLSHCCTNKLTFTFICHRYSGLHLNSLLHEAKNAQWVMDVGFLNHQNTSIISTCVYITFHSFCLPKKLTPAILPFPFCMNMLFYFSHLKKNYLDLVFPSNYYSISQLLFTAEFLSSWHYSLSSIYFVLPISLKFCSNYALDSVKTLRKLLIRSANHCSLS